MAVLEQRSSCQQGLSIVRHYRSGNYLCTAHARQGGNKRLTDGGLCIFVTFAQSITFESIIL